MGLTERAAIALLNAGFSLQEVVDLLPTKSRPTTEQDNHNRMMQLIAQNNLLSVFHDDTATE